jgi:hypothetical protein
MWLPIDDVYSISIDGQVMKNGKLMKGATDSIGYRQVSQHGKLKMVHRLVASRFLPAPPTDEKVEIDHIDRNKSNNHASNLRWCSKSINMKNRKHKVSSDTGEPYIHIYYHQYGRQVSFVFQVLRKNPEFRFKKYFPTLEEAIDFRNNFEFPE